MTIAEPGYDPPSETSTAGRIIAVMGEIGDIPKNGWNSAQSYAFRKVEDVTVRVRDVMHAHGLGLRPVKSELLEASVREKSGDKVSRGVLIRQTYAFFRDDDPTDEVFVEMIGEGQDSLDKATTKALTGAFKYALLQSFSIGEAGDDPDASSGSDDAPESFSASPEEIERAKSALALAHADDLGLVRSWCLLAQFGSLSKEHVDRRLLPAFHALLDALAQSRLDSATGS
jgi:hypothetical protein